MRSFMPLLHFILFTIFLFSCRNLDSDHETKTENQKEMATRDFQFQESSSGIKKYISPNGFTSVELYPDGNIKELSVITNRYLDTIKNTGDVVAIYECQILEFSKSGKLVEVLISLDKDIGYQAKIDSNGSINAKCFE